MIEHETIDINLTSTKIPQDIYPSQQSPDPKKPMQNVVQRSPKMREMGGGWSHHVPPIHAVSEAIQLPCLRAILSHV